MELNAFKPWLVKPASELNFSVPVCCSHVNRVFTRSDCADLDADFFLALFLLTDFPCFTVSTLSAKKTEADEPAQAMQTPLQHSLRRRWLACSSRRPRLCSSEEVAGVSSADPNFDPAHCRGLDIKNRNTGTPRRTPRLYSQVRCTGICTHFSQRRDAVRERG